MIPLARSVERSVLRPLLDFLLPSRCFACRGPLGAAQLHGACADCWCAFRLLERPLCPGCGLPSSPATDLLGPSRGRCARCLLSPPAADRVAAVVEYDGLARAFLLRAKLGWRHELLGPIGARLGRSLTLLGFAANATMVVAVPSHPWTTLRRGFSPAYELARPVAAQLGLPLRRAVLSHRVTVRVSAKRLGARRRLRLARDAFRVRGRLQGERPLVVDDVMTTGATLEACARALRAAGASEVSCAVWARTLPSRWAR